MVVAALVVVLVGMALWWQVDDPEPVVHTNPVDLPIATWIWHFDPRLAEKTAPVYRDLLASIPHDAKIHVLLPHNDAARLFRDVVGPAVEDARLTFEPVHGAIGSWARDFYTTFDRGGVPHVYRFPVAPLIPGEATTERVPGLLRRYLPELEVVHGRDALVGGDHLLTATRILVGDATFSKLVGSDPDARAALAARIETVFGRKPLIVGDGQSVPYFHIDMFLTVLDDRRVLLGDPALALNLVGEAWTKDAPLVVPHLGPFPRRRQMLLLGVYERIRRQLVREGFEVHRIPIAHGEPKPEGRGPGNVLTWNNAVLETRGSRRIAYIPRLGMPQLDEVAKRTYEELGFEVKPVRCALPLSEGGAVHCLTNELRGEASTPISEPESPGDGGGRPRISTYALHETVPERSEKR